MSSRFFQIFQINGRTLVALILVLTSLSLLSCQTYQSKGSGRFAEVVSKDETRDVYAVDLFRYGKFIQAVFRRYALTQPNTRENRYRDDSSCSWTFSTEMYNDTFSLRTKLDNHEVLIVGKLDEESVEVTIEGLGENQEPREMKLYRTDMTPDDDCADNLYVNIRGKFLDQDISNYPSLKKTKEPAFSILWLGTKQVVTGGVISYVGLRQRSRSTLPLPKLLNKGLESATLVPQEFVIDWPLTEHLEVKTQSGATYFSLGIPIIFSDDPDLQPGWFPTDEPIIGTTIESRQNPNNNQPNSTKPTVGYAFLYVENSIHDLAPSLRNRLRVSTPSGEQRQITEIANPNGHIFLTKIHIDGNTITELDILESASQMYLPFYVNDDYAGDRLDRLPRLYP